ncbi:MAG: LacI family DNA-binding transcriptional regulator [Arenibacterium sp.]
MSKRVTIKSIADDLGISHMTVSRALTDNPNVQKETRDAVRKRAAELGYVRSAAARAMRGETSPIIGLLIPNIRNDFYARFANALAEACEANALQLIIRLTKDDPAAERAAITGLREVQARALIMVPTPRTPEDAPAQLEGIRCIQLIREREDAKEALAVLVDDDGAIRDAVKHLAGRGHQHIGFLGASRAFSSGRDRLAAFERGMAEAGLNLSAALVTTESPSVEMGYNATQALITQGKATAVICGGFEISTGALRAAIEADALHTRLAFVGYGDPDYYAWVQGGISTIEVPIDALVRSAMNRLLDDKQPGQPARVGFPARLVIRS